MGSDTIGVAVIGGCSRPAIADNNSTLADVTAKRYGLQR